MVRRADKRILPSLTSLTSLTSVKVVCLSVLCVSVVNTISWGLAWAAFICKPLPVFLGRHC
jgi:hypothetical protein